MVHVVQVITPAVFRCCHLLNQLGTSKHLAYEREGTPLITQNLARETGTLVKHLQVHTFVLVSMYIQ